MKTIIFVFFNLLFCGSAVACSFAKVDNFPPKNPLVDPKGTQLKAPKAEFKVERGYSSELDSCADTGIITIKIDAQGYGSRSAGYVFEVVSSSESQKIFPEVAIYGNSKSVNGVNTFTFPWIDGASDVQEPVKIVVNIYRVNHNWVMSDPTQLVISHRGRI